MSEPDTIFLEALEAFGPGPWKEPNYGTPTSGYAFKAYVFPKKPNDEKARLNLALAIIEAFNNPCYLEKQSHDSKETYFLTVSELIFPGFLVAISNQKHIRLKCQEVENFPIDHFDLFSNVQRREVYRAGFLNVHYDEKFKYVTLEVVGDRWGIEMFPIGHNITEKNMSNYSVRQPRFLQEKFNMTTNQLHFFNGTFQPTYDALYRMTGVFARNPPLRHDSVCIWLS